MFGVWAAPAAPTATPEDAGEAPHLLEWCLGPPWPPRPPKSGIPDRPQNHVLKTQVQYHCLGVNYWQFNVYFRAELECGFKMLYYALVGFNKVSISTCFASATLV